jgi:hypothetical protein
MAIGFQHNAWIAFRATSSQHIHTDGSGGNFAGFLPGGVSVCALHFPVSYDPVTFLVQNLLSCFPYYQQLLFSVKTKPNPSIQYAVMIKNISLKVKERIFLSES